jgi:hypothetical protein
LEKPSLYFSNIIMLFNYNISFLFIGKLLVRLILRRNLSISIFH